MRLWIALHLHRLVLDALRPSWPRDALACVVLDQGQVAAASSAARRQGITPGMRKSGAVLLVPDVHQLERDPEAEHTLMQQVALAMLQYTPDVALADEHSLLLDVSASLMMFKGPHALGRRIARTLHTLNVAAALGMGPTAQGAWLLARQSTGRRRTLRMANMRNRLDALPLSVLPAARSRAAWLAGIGCQTLGDLRALPRAGLQRRIGTELVRSLDTAYGDAPDAHAWFTPPTVFQQRLELLERIEHTSAISAVTQELIGQMSGWLANRQRATTHIVITLDHETGRHACPPTTLALHMAAPAWQATHLNALLREKLDRLVLQSPVMAVGLETIDTVPMPAVSTTLFPEPGGTPADRIRLLDLLSARLGPEQVRLPDSQADHRPELACRWRPAIGPDTRQTSLLTALPHADRPFWLLDPPQALNTRQDKPYYGSPLTLVKGPERIETGWWDGGLAVRDYFVAQDAANAHYWIYRERDNRHARWFLHGLFG